MTPRRVALGWGAVMVLLAGAVAGGFLWSREAPPAPTIPVPSPPDIDAATTADTTTLPPDAQPLKEVPCELTTLLDEYRKGHASPAYRRYVREQLRGLVESLPEDVHWNHLRAEQDVQVLGLLADTWVLRYALDAKPHILERLVEIVDETPDARRRAALIRSLVHTGEPSTQLLGLQVLKHRDDYRAWATDAAPEVRHAVVENFREEAARNNGRYPILAERAVLLATVTQDAATAAGLLGASSLEAVSAPSVARVRTLLQSSMHPEVRAAAARALATSPVTELPASLDALAARYPNEPDSNVREALLESISRGGLSRAVPVLQQLRGTDATAVDRWLALLAERPQSWELLDIARRRPRP